jgi:hypothetical protein
LLFEGEMDVETLDVTTGTARFLSMDFTGDLDPGDSVTSAAALSPFRRIRSFPDPIAAALAVGSAVVAGNIVQHGRDSRSSPARSTQSHSWRRRRSTKCL